MWNTNSNRRQRQPGIPRRRRAEWLLWGLAGLAVAAVVIAAVWAVATL